MLLMRFTVYFRGGKCESAWLGDIVRLRVYLFSEEEKVKEEKEKEKKPNLEWEMNLTF